jgi:uncharacterized membrane protein YhiD involved in acid resistance
LKEGATVRGTATAASIWTTGALGAAVAYNQYELALLLSLVTYLTLRLLTPLEQQINKADLDSQHNQCITFTQCFEPSGQSRLITFAAEK